MGIDENSTGHGLVKRILPVSPGRLELPQSSPMG